MPKIYRGLNRLGGRCGVGRALVEPVLLAAGFVGFSAGDSLAAAVFAVEVLVLPRVARARRAFAISVSFVSASCSFLPTVEKKPASRLLGAAGGSTSAIGSTDGVSWTGCSACSPVVGVTSRG